MSTKLKTSQDIVTGMLMLCSLTSIFIEYEENIIIIKKIGRPSHEFVVKDFIEDHYFSATSINMCEWY